MKVGHPGLVVVQYKGSVLPGSAASSRFHICLTIMCQAKWSHGISPAARDVNVEQKIILKCDEAVVAYFEVLIYVPEFIGTIVNAIKST